MKLIDMKLPKKTKKELKEEMATMPLGGAQPEYPYGMELRFEKEQIEKIKILKSIKANADVKIHAEGFVKEVRIVDTADEKRSRQSVEIQITKLAISNDQAEEEDADEAFDEGAKD